MQGPTSPPLPGLPARSLPEPACSTVSLRQAQGVRLPVLVASPPLHSGRATPTTAFKAHVVSCLSSLPPAALPRHTALVTLHRRPSARAVPPRTPRLAPQVSARSERHCCLPARPGPSREDGWSLSESKRTGGRKRPTQPHTRTWLPAVRSRADEGARGCVFCVFGCTARQGGCTQWEQPSRCIHATHASACTCPRLALPVALGAEGSTWRTPPPTVRLTSPRPPWSGPPRTAAPRRQLWPPAERSPTKASAWTPEPSPALHTPSAGWARSPTLPSLPSPLPTPSACGQHCSEGSSGGKTLNPVCVGGGRLQRHFIPKLVNGGGGQPPSAPSPPPPSPVGRADPCLRLVHVNPGPGVRPSQVLPTTRLSCLGLRPGLPAQWPLSLGSRSPGLPGRQQLDH